MAEEHDLDTPPVEPGRIPYDRFQRVVEQRNDAQGQIVDLKNEIADLQAQASTASALTVQLEEARAGLEALRVDHARDLTLIGAGFTDDAGRAVARMFYDRASEDTRGDMAAWVDGLRADPSNAPIPLRPYLTPAEAPASTVALEPESEQGTGAPSRPPLPPSSAGARVGVGENGSIEWTPERIKQLTPEQYTEHRDAILASMNRRG